MSTNETENDHDYAAFRLRSLIIENENLSLRQLAQLIHNPRYQVGDPLHLAVRNTPNSGNNYNPRNGVISSSVISTNASGGIMEDDNDIFEDESAGAGNDVLSSGSTAVTYETDTRLDGSISTATTNSSDQTRSAEQSISSDRPYMSEHISDSLASASALSERDNTNEISHTTTIASTSSDMQQVENLNENTNIEVISLDTPTQPKKRKRLSFESNVTPTVKAKFEAESSDEDDGLTCSICLDNWEMTGEHRLASLKCGHLFGNSCIRRWLQESFRQSQQRVCPQCKTKAHPKEIRYLYAKRVRAIDRSEEHRLRDKLTDVQDKAQSLMLELATLKMSYAQVTEKLKALEADNETLNILLQNGGGYARSNKIVQKESSLYKLFMDRNIEISKEPGCRVLVYAKQQENLIVSQKSSQNLFPGYGLRFVDVKTFKPSNFLHTSHKLIRDISLSDDQEILVAVASMEAKVKLFDLRSLSVAEVFKPAEKPIWSCTLGQRNSVLYMYLGSQNGSIYVYDTRFPEAFVTEHQSECDLSPVVQVASIPACQLFPYGGFLVCKLTSMWFYEHSGATTHATRFPIEGRFISMDFDAVQLKLLIQTRSCVRYPRARYIFGKLNKINEIPIFDIHVTFFASTNSPVMARCSQIGVESNTLVAAYIQDPKLLSLYDANREQCVQSLPSQNIIYDSCPIYTKDFTFLAALTETKCRLYKLKTS